MRRFMIAAATLGAAFLMTESQADAQYGCRAGYGGYGSGVRISYGSGYGLNIGYSSGFRAPIYNSYRPTRLYYHDTSHYHYHPPSLQRHRNHYHYIPGHYDLHRTGHYHRR